MHPVTQTYPLTASPQLVAFSAILLALSKPSFTVQLMLALLNPSVALIKTATSLTSYSSAISRPFILGTNTGRRILGSLCSDLISSMRSTSRQSDNCGTARGETTDVNSMVRRPVPRSRRINSIFTDVGTGSLIFCRPSRGPTSTIRTAPLGSFIAVAASGRN